MEDGSVATVDLGIEGLDDDVTDERVRLRFERECWDMGALATQPNIERTDEKLAVLHG